MEINLTRIVEKTLKDLIGGEKGIKVARLYHKYWNPINFTIIGLLGVAVYYVTVGIFQVLLGWFGSLISIGIAGFCVWSMSVGPFCHLWGYKKQNEDLKVLVTEVEKS